MRNIAVIEDAKLSNHKGKRYIVVDKNTGEVLDNAQGYGYKSIRNAYAAYGYKNQDPEKEKEKRAKREHIRKWMKENAGFVHLMDGIALEIAKGSWGPDDKFDAKLVRQMLKENNLETDFTSGDLLREWRKR